MSDKITDECRCYSEKAMAPHSSTLAWKIPWMEEPGGLQSMGLLRVGHDWATSLSFFAFLHWRRKWQPTPVFLPGESQGWRSLVGCRLWVMQSRTWLKRLSSSSSRCYYLKKRKTSETNTQEASILDCSLNTEYFHISKMPWPTLSNNSYLWLSWLSSILYSKTGK